MRALLKTLLSLSVAAAAGCASVPVPSEQMARSEGRVRAAEEIGAPKSPSAALYLQLAKDEIEQAKKMMKEGDNQRAAAKLARAEADADLALALARAANVRTEAELSEAKAKGDNKPQALAPTH